MGDEVKIVILGDRGVGKTSLILTLVTEEFCSKPPRTVNRIGITSDAHISSAGLTYLVDYSEANSEEILEDADVVCLCHNVAEIESLFESVEKWLSIVRLQAYKSPPVIIVGTKSDLIGGNHSRQEFNNSWNEKCKALMSRYPEVASALECSSKLNMGVLNVFVDAQKCALYPLCPVFNARSGKLTLEASRALRRIFHIADVNKDDVLDFHEIGELQRKAFNTHLGDQGYEDIRELINSSIQNGVVKQGVTIEGFFALQAELCKNLKQEVVWTLLKAFGYTLKCGEVRLELHPILRNCFSKVDAEKEGIIGSEKIKKIFSGCERIPREFDLALESTPVEIVGGKRMISMSSWLARWELFMLLDCEKCLSNLILLGAVHGSLGLNQKQTTSSIQALVKIGADLPSRPVTVSVCGDRMTRKSALVNGLINNCSKKFNSSNSNNQKISSKRINFDDLTITLILQEVPLEEMHTISSDVILATYCTSADFSQEKLLAKLTELKKHRIEAPEIILCRTRAELCSSSSSLSDQIIRGFSSFKGEILFYSANISEEFYSNLAEIILKQKGVRFKGPWSGFLRKSSGILSQPDAMTLSIAFGLGVLLLAACAKIKSKN